MASAMALRAVARLGMRHGGVLPLAASRGEAMPCVGHLARVLQQPSLGGLGCLTSCLYSTYPPHTVLEMPSLSPTMSQGNIASWTKAVGDSVSAGDVIAEIETDKATIEWESVDDGFMARILMPEGSSDLPVGTPVAVLCEEEEDLGSFETFSAADAATGGGAEVSPAAAPEPAPAAPPAEPIALDLPPHTVLEMPSLSPTMTQGNIAAWQKAVGDAIEAGEVIAEVETDKATIEWESVDGGFLAKIFAGPEDSDIQVGTPVAIVCEDEESISAFADVTAEALAGAESPPAEASPKTPAPTPDAPAAPAASASPAPAIASSGSVAASPLAKALAREQGYDLSKIAGTGPGGRVIAADVREYVPSEAPSVAASGAFVAEGGYMDTPVSQIRRITAKRLSLSKQTIPHYYLSMDCRMDAVAELRASVNASIASGGMKVSLNDFVVKAAALSCQAVPECNAEWHEDFVRMHKPVHVGVAMDLGSLGHTVGGLIVPVVRDAHAKGITGIAADVKQFAAQARAEEGRDGQTRIPLASLDGGTFTVSNLGMFGIRQFVAIVNPPQSCILAVGTVRDELVPAGEGAGVRAAKVMTVTLSCDHRVVDGAVGSTWLKHFKDLIENPLKMLV